MKNKILLNKLIILFAIVPALDFLAIFIIELPSLHRTIPLVISNDFSISTIIYYHTWPLIYFIAAIIPALLAKIELEFANVKFGPKINNGTLYKINTKKIWFVAVPFLVYCIYTLFYNLFILSKATYLSIYQLPYFFLIPVAVLTALRIKDILTGGNKRVEHEK